MVNKQRMEESNCDAARESSVMLIMLPKIKVCKLFDIDDRDRTLVFAINLASVHFILSKASKEK